MRRLDVMFIVDSLTNIGPLERLSVNLLPNLHTKFRANWLGTLTATVKLGQLT